MSDENANVSKIEPLSFASERFDNSEYTKVAQRARLRDIRLMSSTYKVDMQSFFDAASQGKITKQAFGGEPGWHQLSDQGTLAGEYLWQASVRFGGRKNALKIQATYVLIYSGLEGANEEYAHLYFQKLARFASYPYFRTHVALHTSSSGLSLEPLPSLIDRVD